MSFRHLGIELSIYGDVEKVVIHRVNRTNKPAGCPNDTIWTNKHLNETKNIKSTILQFMRYAAETRPDTFKTRQLLEEAEMNGTMGEGQ